MKNFVFCLILLATPFSIASARVKQDETTRLFRDIFHTYLQDDAASATLQTQDLILLPPDAIVRPPLGLQGPDPLKAILKAHSRFSADDLYQRGLALAPRTIPQLEQVFASSGPITIIVVPGIYGEFFGDPFSEILAAGGTFKNRWQERLREIHDYSYSLEKLDDEDVTLDQVIDIASIDDARGQPLVNMIYLKPRLGSLETLGSSERVIDIYLRRLNKLFKALLHISSTLKSTCQIWKSV